MAEENKNVEVPKETVPAVAEPVAADSAAPAEPAVAAEPAAAATETTTAEPAAAEATETPAAAAEEAKKEEVTPIEEGILEAKGSSFPKNFIYSKKYFWFGDEAVEPKHMNAYIRGEKVGEVAHHVAAWASHTGKGLLFYNEKPNDKSTPHGAIQLAEASEPTVDGTHKFHLTSKGHKHTFKAASAAERDNWVAQIKAKIAEAKELATAVTESETYKATIESFKPAPPAKKEEKKTEEAAKEEAPKEAAPAEEAKTEEPAKEAGKLEEPAKEEPKRRSASRKRGSIFGSLMGKKDEEKKEVKKDEKPAEAAAATETPAAETSAPAAETVAATEAAPATDAPAAEAEAPVEAAATEAKAPETKPAPAKRASIFGNLNFGRKKAEAESAPAPPAKDAPAEGAAVSQNAPVIPAVETTEPLSAEVASPANVPTETVDATPATNGETKKEMKSDKRKSSLPFGFGAKKEKSASSDEEGDKPKSPFSKFRATIKGKGKAEKPAEKTEEKPAEAEASKEAEPAAAAEAEAAKPVEPETAAPATTEETPAADKPLAATPQVAATA
ncbi:uncharacterized protein E0L32_011255 [Thyridium curvatum]|uniref:PH domain-containing protein n=1 Tax=Thyridium curvatum TaxID=1093900 RepID=A0A507BJQ7_9PEZI|nr:uncharacterized protein E0L32_011255 [Thyridium curvatum]TPX19094.1 hypothetical protein E0L32_011255 [Thyridium curvatum]